MLIRMKMSAAPWPLARPSGCRRFPAGAALMRRGCRLALVALAALPCFSSRGAAGTGVAAVHTFSALEGAFPSPIVNGDGASPGAGMALGSDGNLYGTTLAGGMYGGGIIFRLSPSNSLVDLFDFQAILNTDDQEYLSFGPNELTAGPKGFFYGTTQFGGSNQNGTIFVFSPASGEEAVSSIASTR